MVRQLNKPLSLTSSKYDNIENEKLIKSFMKQHHIPGCVYAVSKNGQLLFEKTFGYSNLEYNLKITPHTIFEIGSISQMFIVIGILILIQQKRISLTDTLTKYLKNKPPYSWSSITIHDLLQHTSCIECLPHDFNWSQDMDLYTMIYNLPLKKDKVQEYNEVNFLVLGIIITIVTKQSYQEFIQKYIFDPLHMDSSRVIDFENIVTNRSYAYTYRNGQLENINNRAFNITGQFGIELTIFDLLKLDQALYTDTFLNQEYKSLFFDYTWTYKDNLLSVNSQYNCCSSVIIHDSVNKYTLFILTNFINSDTTASSPILYNLSVQLLQDFTLHPSYMSKIDNIDLILEDQIRQKLLPGCVIGIFKNGKPLLKKAYGSADLENNIPMKTSSLFMTGSLGKHFTAVGILLLIQDGLMDFKDLVQKYLPEAPWKTMKIYHLLGHTAGLGTYDETIQYDDEITEKELLDLIYKTPLQYEPGDDWEYSNSGYAVLGIILGRVSKMSFEEFCIKRIFKPVGMKDSCFVHEKTPTKNRVKGYVLNEDKKLVNQETASESMQSFGDGPFMMTIDDYLMWDKSLYNNTILTPESIRFILSPTVLNDGKTYPYNCGLFREKDINDHVIFAHNGCWRGIVGEFYHVQDQHLTLIILVNLVDYDTIYLVNSMLNILLT
jgi:CubicO group peptidase (beta-lactamase class C family)